MKYIIGRREVRKINLPKPGSHKGENGRLLIIAGNRQYHGSLLFAVKAASRLVDLIYVWSTKSNQSLVAKLKERTAQFIAVNRMPRELDCILIGPGLGVNRRTYNLVRRVLKSGIKAVLDADALKVLDGKLLKLLNANHILTPHIQEFRTAFNLPPSAESVRTVAGKYHCGLVLKGKTDILAIYQFYRIGKYKKERAKLWYNTTGNQGMTKGGTGDVLAGLIAGFFCKNESFEAAAVGTCLNGMAGDELFKKQGPFYDSEDLLMQIPQTLWRLTKHGKI